MHAGMSAVIDDHRASHGVEPIRRMLPSAPSTYYAYAARRVDPSRLPPRAGSDAALAVVVQRAFVANCHGYGVCKVSRQVGRDGITAARCTVARLIRATALKGFVRVQKVRTRITDPAAICPRDRVNRKFKALCPNPLTHSALVARVPPNDTPGPRLAVRGRLQSTDRIRPTSPPPTLQTGCGPDDPYDCDPKPACRQARSRAEHRANYTV